MDYCAFLKSCTNFPEKKVDLTVRDFLGLRAHVKVCEPCHKLIYTSAPEEVGFYRGEVN